MSDNILARLYARAAAVCGLLDELTLYVGDVRKEAAAIDEELGGVYDGLETLNAATDAPLPDDLCVELDFIEIKNHHRTACHILKGAVREEVLEIEMEDGRQIVCTKDHKIRVNRGGEDCWIEAGDIDENDDIVDVANIFIGAERGI